MSSPYNFDSACAYLIAKSATSVTNFHPVQVLSADQKSLACFFHNKSSGTCMITTEDLPINTNTAHHGANINFKAFMTVKLLKKLRHLYIGNIQAKSSNVIETCKSLYEIPDSDYEKLSSIRDYFFDKVSKFVNEFVNDPSFFETSEMEEILAEVSRRTYVLFPRKELVCIMRKLRDDEEDTLNNNTTKTMKFISKYSQAHDKVVLVLISVDFERLEITEMIRASETRKCFEMKHPAHPVDSFESFLNTFLSKSYLESRETSEIVHRTEDFLKLATSNTAFFGQIDKIFTLLDSADSELIQTGLKQISQFCKHKSSTSAYHIPHLPLSISLISLILNSDCESVVDYSNRYTIIFSQESKLRESIIHTMESLCKSCRKANESIITELLYHLKMNKNTTILYALIAILVDKDVFHRVFCMKGGFSLLLNQLYNALHYKIPDGFASCTSPSCHKPETSTSFENSNNNTGPDAIKLLAAPRMPNLEGIKTKKQKHLKYLCLTPSSKNILGYIFYTGGRGEVINHISQIKNIQRLLIILNKSNNFNVNVNSLLHPSEITFNSKDEFDDEIPTPGGVNPSIMDNKQLSSLHVIPTNTLNGNGNGNNSRKEMKIIAATASPVTDRVKSRSHLITSRTKPATEEDTSLTVIVTSHILLAVSQILRVKRDGFNLYSTNKELSAVNMIQSIDFNKVIPHCVYCDGFMDFAYKDEEQVSFISSARSFDDNNINDKKNDHLEGDTDDDESGRRRRASAGGGVIENKELSIGTVKNLPIDNDIHTATPDTTKSTPTPKPFIPPLALELPSDNYSNNGLYGFQQGYAKIAGYTNATTTTNTTTTKTCLLEEIAYEPPLSYTPYLICQNPYYVLFDLISENEITENPICRQLIYDILLNYKKEVVVTRKQIPSELLEGKDKSKESEVVTIKTTQSNDIFIISLCNQIERYCKAIQLSFETCDQSQTSRSKRGCPIHLQFQDSKVRGIEQIFRSNVKHLTTIFHILNEYCSNLYSCLSNTDLNPLINTIITNYRTILDIVYLSLPCHHGSCGKECEFDDIFYFIPIFSIIQFPFLCCFGLAIPTPVVTLLSTIKTISGIGVSIITTIVDFYSWGDIESNEYLRVYIKSIIKYLILYFECNASATYHYLEYNPSRVETKYSELKPLIVDQYSILFNLCSLQTKHILSLSSVLISFLDLLIECLSINISLSTNYDDLTGIVNTLLSTFFSLYSLQTKSDVSTVLCIKFLECLNKMIAINNDTVKKVIKDQHVLDALIKEISYLTDIPTIIQDSETQICKYKKKGSRSSVSHNGNGNNNVNSTGLSIDSLNIPSLSMGINGNNNGNITAERAITLLASNKKIFKNTTLHAELLTCLFLILVDKDNNCLNSTYTSQFPSTDPANDSGIDYLDILTNHVTNTDMIPILQPLINNLNNYGRSYYILLRLLTSDLFHTNLYTNVKKISSAGCYGTVYSYDFVISSDYGIIHPVAVKMVSTHPKSGRNALFSIYPEVSVMYKLKGHHEICQLMDYGVHHSHYWIVMESCLMSVRDLILERNEEVNDEYKLLIFLRILYCVKFLHNNNIIHGDIKCGNVLIRNYEFNKPSSVCISDFGSCMSVNGKKFVTGTECIRSPEMIKEKLNEITTSSDIWSLGCLFYELMSGGDYLFVNGDVSKSVEDGSNILGTNFQLLLQTSGSVISSEKERKLKNNKNYINFLNYVCNRNAKERPTINDVIDRFESLLLNNLKLPSSPLSLAKSSLNVKKSKPGVGAGVGLSLGHGTNFGIEKYDESLVVWITRNIAVTSISNVTPNLLWKNHFAYCIHICTNPNCHHSFDWITTLLWRGLIELYYRDCQTTEDLNSICEQIRLVTRGGGSVLITITPFVISALYTILYYHLVKHYFLKPLDAMIYLMNTYDPFYGNIHIPSELLCSNPTKPLDDNYVGYYFNSCTCHGMLYILNVNKNKSSLKKDEKIEAITCDCSHHCRSCRYTKRLTLNTKSKAKWLMGEMNDLLCTTKDEIKDGKYVYKSINLNKLVEYENGKGSDKRIGNDYKIYSCKHCSCPVVAVHNNGKNIGFYANNCIYYESSYDIEIPFFGHLNN